MTELDPSQSRLLGALTLAALKHLGCDTLVVDADNNLCPNWRMVRIDDVALLEKPADNQSPKRIDCYQVAKRSSNGAAFKLDPARLVYSLQWQHNAYPPDFELMLLQDEPQQWVNTANLTLLAELRRQAAHAVDWSQLRALVPLLDAFEAARR
jgi:hypothetical protein